MRYFIIAGERSGDLHASNLIKSLKKYDPEAEIYGWGGEMMSAAGAEVLKSYDSISFMGFSEVITHFRKIVKALKDFKKDISNISPDVFIPVDFAGFNLRIAEYAKAKGIPVHYYISPKVWAWNQSRAYKIKKLVDKMFVILPFEVDFYKKYDLSADYIGNPLIDAISAFTPDPGFEFKKSDQIVAILPGSRKQEVKAMTEEILPVIKDNPKINFVVAAVSNLNESLYGSFKGLDNVKVITDKTYDLLSIAHAAIVTSGTATLETALFNVPQIVVYKASPITYSIVKRLIKVKYISLVNLIANKQIVPEQIQKGFTAERVNSILKDLVSPSNFRQQQLKEYEVLNTLMGEKGASDKAAKIIVETLKKNSR